MKSVRKPVCLTSIAMLIIAFLLGSLAFAPVAASAVLYTPINTTIPVESGQNFVLGFNMAFDNTSANTPGYFSTTFFWDNNETDPNAENLNFTYVGYSITPDPFGDKENVTIKKERPYGYPADYYRYTVQISETYGEATNTPFWVNVTMGAYGIKGGEQQPHHPGEYNITIVKVRCYEYVYPSVGPGDVTINVTGYSDVRVANVKATCPKEDLDPVTQGYGTWTINVNVTVENVGTLQATFDVTANYENATGRYTIGTTNVVLAAGLSTSVILQWTPASSVEIMAAYTISGNASIPPGDINMTNNYLADGTYKLKWPGDASNDDYVDVDDLVALGMSWLKSVGDPGYNAQADFSFDAYIDVDDLVVLGMNWLQPK